MIDFEFDKGILTKADVYVQHTLFKNSKVANQYNITISRIAPFYPIHKSLIISQMVKRVSIVHDAIGEEEILLGSAYLNLLLNQQVGEITISFVEDKDASVLDFLKKDNGNDIFPTDGTFLLPYDYYFRIEITHYKSSLPTPKHTILLEGDYILSNNFPHEYQAGEEELQMVDATFKPIKSWK